MIRALTVVALLVASLALRAHAQDDDWSLTRPGSTHHGPTHRRATRPSPSTQSESRLIDRYRAMVQRDPSESFALARWVTLAIARDGSAEAITSEMQAARASDADTIVPRLVLAYLARHAGRVDEARALYREVSAAHPSDAIGYAELARTEREARSLAAARAAYEDARSHAHGDPAATLAREELDVLVELGDVDAATALDAQLAGARPSAERRLELPRAWLAHQQPEASLAALEAIEPRISGDRRARIPVRMERARAEIALGRTADALASLDVVLRSARGGVRVEAYQLAYEAHRQAGSLEALATVLGAERSADALTLLARIEDERGHDDAALAAYDRSLRLRPRDADLRERRAHTLLRMGRVDEATAALEALWRSAPDDTDHLIEAATLLVDQGRPTEARALLAMASASRPHDARLHARLAEVLSRWGDDPSALAEARRLAQLEPSDPAHRALVGDLLLASGERSAALAAFREMIALDASAAGHDRLAMVLADHDLLDDARAELTEATRLAPDDRGIAVHFADVLARAGRDADAEPIAARVLTLSRGDAALEHEARAALVAIWARRRTLDRHIHALDAELATAPDIGSGLLLAEALRRDGSLPRAEEVLARLAALAPSNADTWTSLEHVRALRGDLPGAIDALEHAAAVDSPRAAMYLARMSEDALALYRDDDAIRYAERALALAPDDAHGHVRLGELYRRRQDDTAAAASYRRALVLDPDLHDVALSLAELSHRRGDDGAADGLYAHVIDASPDDDLTSRAIDASLEIELARGDAEPLFDRLVTLALAHYDRPLLARAALAVLDVIASPLLPRATAGDASTLAMLHRIASRGLGVLLRALASSDPSEQRTALSILGAARVEAAAPALLALGEAHDEGALGVEALASAARVATAPLIPRLIVIARGADPLRARVAAWAIARIGGPEGTRALIGLLDAPGDVAAAAAIGLAHEHAATAAPNIARALESETSVLRRAAFTLALSALGRAPASATCASLGEVGGAARAVALLVCPDDHAIAYALLGTPDAASAMRAATHRAGDVAAAWPEPRAGEPAVALALRAMDLAPPRSVSLSLEHAVGTAIGEGLASATPITTLRLLTVRDDQLALSAADAAASRDLLAHTSDTVLAALPARAGDPDARAAVARLLARLAPDDPRVIALLGDGDRQIVRAALEGLDARASVPASLAAALATIAATSGDWVARLAAVRALGRAPEGGEAALIQALGADVFAFVREAAATALGSRGHRDDARAALRAAAQTDAEEQVRAAAVAALR